MSFPCLSCSEGGIYHRNIPINSFFCFLSVKKLIFCASSTASADIAALRLRNPGQTYPCHNRGQVNKHQKDRVSWKTQTMLELLHNSYFQGALLYSGVKVSNSLALKFSKAEGVHPRQAAQFPRLPWQRFAAGTHMRTSAQAFFQQLSSICTSLRV